MSDGAAIKSTKVEQLFLSSLAFFWCFVLWFSTAAFSPTISEEYHLTVFDAAVLASSAMWLTPFLRPLVGVMVDRLGAPYSFAVILITTGLLSIVSSFAEDYATLFVLRLLVASAGTSFVVGIQHMSRWFDDNDMGMAQGLYAGIGNAGAGVAALLLPRIYGTDYSSAFLHSGAVAIVVAGYVLTRGVASGKNEHDAAGVRRVRAAVNETFFIWTRFAALALMVAYAISFGLEISLDAWLPTYYSVAFEDAIKELGFFGIEAVQVAVGTFAAVHSFNAALLRPFGGYMSDLWQRKGWMPFPLITRELPYAPRIHWIVFSLFVIILGMTLLTFAGLSGWFSMSVAALLLFGMAESFGTGGVFALVPVMFKRRTGTATGFISGGAILISISYPFIFNLSANMHIGYAYMAFFVFMPLVLFFIWAMNHDIVGAWEGLGSRHFWTGVDEVKGNGVEAVDAAHTAPGGWYYRGIKVMRICMVVAAAITLYALFVASYGAAMLGM